MDLVLKDDIVLVTGSSSGVDRTAAVAFGAEGARVAVGIMKTVRELTIRGARSKRQAGKRSFRTTISPILARSSQRM